MTRKLGRASTFSRRDILRLGGAVAASSALGLTACSSGKSGGGNNLQIGIVASISSQFPIFDKLIKDYRNAHPDVTIQVQPMPAESFFSQLDTRLAAGNAPDIVYMQNQSVGRYAKAGALVDLTKYLGNGYGDAYIDAFWRAASRDGKAYGIPYQTNAFALYYNKKHLSSAGITDIPASLDDAWTWDEFITVLRRIKDKGATKTPFAYNWTQNNGYRWMPLLYMHGGKLLSDDLKDPAIDTPAGVEAIEWTKRWFTDGLAPANTSVKSSEDIANLFSIGGISMMANGAFVMPLLNGRMNAADWDVTFLFQDKGKATDFGGNCLVVTKDSKNPEAAANFIKFMAEDANMKYYASQAQTIPTRKLVQEGTIDYGVRPELMNRVFRPSVATVPASMAAAQTIPQFGAIRSVLDNQLDLAFTSGQSAAATAKNIAAEMRKTLQN